MLNFARRYSLKNLALYFSPNRTEVCGNTRSANIDGHKPYMFFIFTVFLLSLYWPKQFKMLHLDEDAPDYVA